MLGSTAQYQRDRHRVLATCYKDHVPAADLLLLDHIRGTDIGSLDLIEIRDVLSTCCFCQFIKIALLASANCHDPCLCKEMLRHVIDPLLAEENGCTAVSDLCDHILKHLLFLIQE